MKTYFAIAFLLVSHVVFAADSCPVIQPVAKAIPAHDMIYSDTQGAKSVIDKAKYDHMLTIIRPLRAQVTALQDLASSAYINKDAEAAACALGNLQHWATSKSVTEVDTNGLAFSSASEQRWVTISIALSYTYVKRWAMDEQKQEIEKWLNKIGSEIITNTSAGGAMYFKPGTENNHEYWNGAAYIALAAATGEGKYLKKAHRSYDMAIGEIKNGFLPKEIARDQQALHYHGFALAPIMLMAEMSKKFDQNWAGSDPEELKKLIYNTSYGFAHPDWFAEQAGGFKQHLYGDSESDRLWILFARREFPDAVAPEATVTEKSVREYVSHINELLDAGYFTDPVQITKKARWWD